MAISIIAFFFFIGHIKKEKQQRQQELKTYVERISKYENKINACVQQINSYEQKIQNLKTDINTYSDNLSAVNKQLFNKQQQLNTYVNNMWQAKRKTEQVESEYNKKLQNLSFEYDTNKEVYNEKIDTLKKQVASLSNTLAAAAQANLRQQEKKDNLDFYRIILSKEDIQDIEKLNSLKEHFHHPEVISKLIWSQYIQKRVGQLCARVFGTTTICGVYKITNINTQQYYIGQSVNIIERTKEHIKHGLGIDYNGNNKLYRAMQQYGVWNFTFELMEKCERQQLDKVEAKWIELYQADTLGYNSTQGNNKGK